MLSFLTEDALCILFAEQERGSAVLLLARRSEPSRVLVKVWLDRPSIVPLRSRATESPLELVVVFPTMRFCPSRTVKTLMFSSPAITAPVI